VSVRSTSLMRWRRSSLEALSCGLAWRSSSMKSPKWLSSLSPTGRSSEIGCRLTFMTRRVSSMGIFARSAISSTVGSRPSSCTR